jgi:putative flippase GtrA
MPTVMKNITSHLAKETGSLFRFGVVGVIATLVYYGVAQILDYMELGPYTSNFLAYVSGATISFCGHFLFTFGHRSKVARRLVRYLLVSVSGYALSHLIVYIILIKLGYPFWLATLVVALTIPTASWAASRYWAFA